MHLIHPENGKAAGNTRGFLVSVMPEAETVSHIEVHTPV